MFPTNTRPSDCHPNQARVEFVAAYFKSPFVWKEVAAGSQGLGDRRQRVQPEKILSHKVWLPPMEWQNRIAQVPRWADVLKTVQTNTIAELNDTAALHPRQSFSRAAVMTNRNDKALLSLAAKTLRDELRQRHEGTALRCHRRLYPFSTYTDSAALAVAHLDRSHPRLANLAEPSQHKT